MELPLSLTLHKSQLQVDQRSCCSGNSFQEADKQDLMTFKNFCTARKWWREEIARYGREIFASYTSDTGLVSRIYKRQKNVKHDIKQPSQ